MISPLTSQHPLTDGVDKTTLPRTQLVEERGHATDAS